MVAWSCENWRQTDHTNINYQYTYLCHFIIIVAVVGGGGATDAATYAICFIDILL